MKLENVFLILGVGCLIAGVIVKNIPALGLIKPIIPVIAGVIVIIAAAVLEGGFIEELRNIKKARKIEKEKNN